MPINKKKSEYVKFALLMLIFFPLSTICSEIRDVDEIEAALPLSFSPLVNLHDLTLRSGKKHSRKCHKCRPCHKRKKVIGPTGATGPMGIPGATGLIGVTGLAGATGEAGNIGATGAIGLTGATGGIGITGITGSTGPIGLTGPETTGFDNYLFAYTSKIVSQSGCGSECDLLIAYETIPAASQNWLLINPIPPTGIDTFNVPQNGVYLFTYHTEILTMLGWEYAMEILVNGSRAPGTDLFGSTAYINGGLPEVQFGFVQNFGKTALVQLTAGETVSIRLKTQLSGPGSTELVVPPPCAFPRDNPCTPFYSPFTTGTLSIVLVDDNPSLLRSVTSGAASPPFKKTGSLRKCSCQSP